MFNYGIFDGYSYDMWISRIDKNSNDGLYFQWVKWRYLMYIFIHTDTLRLVNTLSNYHFDLNGVSLSFTLSPFWDKSTFFFGAQGKGENKQQSLTKIAEDYTEFLAAAMERKSLVGARIFWVETSMFCGVCCSRGICGFQRFSGIFTWDYGYFWISVSIIWIEFLMSSGFGVFWMISGCGKSSSAKMDNIGSSPKIKGVSRRKHLYFTVQIKSKYQGGLFFSPNPIQRNEHRKWIDSK